MERSTDGLLGQLLATACEWNRLPQLLRLIFRRHELEKFNNRVAILQGLITGKTYEEIRGELGVGVDTIARMSLILEPNREVVGELLAEIREVGGDKELPALPREEEVILLPAVEDKDHGQPLPAKEGDGRDGGRESSRGDRKRSIYKFG